MIAGNSFSKKWFASGFVFATVFFGIALPSFCNAESYDFYVEKGSEKDGADGSKTNPFSSISKAVEKSLENGSGSRSIYVKSGEYDEAVTLGKNVKLHGESLKKVSIRSVTMKDGSLLKEITVSGGSSGITAEKGADVLIENCAIKDSESIGINALPGSGKVTLTNSSVYKNGTKGLYIQAGRKIELIGNKIYSNKEEGVDIRSNTEGIIKNNEIYENGESGIELVIGSSELDISKNNIRKNQASAIATQFYKENKKSGIINITGNSLEKSRKYGLDCALPSGGEVQGSYWNESINLKDNVIEGNKLDSINNFCNIIDAVEEEVEEKNNIIKDDTSIMGDVGRDEDVKNDEDAENDEDIEKEEMLWEKVQSLSLWEEEASKKSSFEMEKIRKRSPWKTFFVGIDRESMVVLKKEAEEYAKNTSDLEAMYKDAKNENNKKSIEALLKKMKEDASRLEKTIAENENKRSLFGWIWKFFRS